MDLNYVRTNPTVGKPRRGAVIDGGTAGLSSPTQLVEITASVSVKIDQSASGHPLIIVNREESQSFGKGS